MKYDIEIETRALKALKKVPFQDQKKIINAIQKLAMNPRPQTAKKLVGREGFRIRIGNYRVIYEIKGRVCYILILDVGHRKNIYRS